MKSRTLWAVLSFILCLTSVSFSAILLSHPVVGGQLDILDEGAGNASVLILAPDGSRQTLMLQNGQLSLPVSQPGRWMVRIGNEQARTDAAMPSALPAAPYPSPAAPPLLLVLISAGLLIILALTSAAAWSAAFPPAPPQSPMLQKRRQGGEVLVCLRAGSRPLENVILADENPSSSSGAPLRLRARRLPAGERLQLHYSHAGPLGWAQANFIQDKTAHTLRCQEGSVMLNLEPTPALAGRSPAPIPHSASSSSSSSPLPSKPKPLARLPRAHVDE